MSELLDEIRASFTAVKEETEQAPDDSGVVVEVANDVMPPGARGLTVYANQVMLVITRRAYRWYAGAMLPTDSGELLELTSRRMANPVTKAVAEAFASGVMIGHRSDPHVRSHYESDAVDHLFTEDEFHVMAQTMATGFTEDSEVWEFFHHYVTGATDTLAHVSGFAHHEKPHKVWDVWMISGIASITASFMSGHRLGKSWYERDILDGILIATEEVPH